MCKINCLLYYFFVLILNVGKLCFGDVKKIFSRVFFCRFCIYLLFYEFKKIRFDILWIIFIKLKIDK